LLIDFLVDEGLRDLQCLNLRHSLAIALSLALFTSGLSTLAHGSDLSLQDGTVTACSDLLRASCYDFLAQATIFHS
jgi:hypothetical protein